MSFCLLFFILFLIYAVLISLLIHKILNKNLSFLKKSNENLELKYKPFERKDFNQWNHFEIYFMAIFFLPVRIFLFFSLVILGYIATRILSSGINDC